MTCRKNTISSSRNHKITVFKYLTVFFLGASCVTLLTQAFDISMNVNNAIQYIQRIFITSDGTNNGTVGIILDGSGDAFFS
ncbi:MAG: hypothetical protein WCG98_02335 [bacterium]